MSMPNKAEFRGRSDPECDKDTPYDPMGVQAIQEALQLQYHQRESTWYLYPHAIPTPVVSIADWVPRSNSENAASLHTKKRGAVREVFETMRKQWRAETRFDSSGSNRVNNPAYFRIIGLGPDVIPIIFRSMRDEPDYWFVALEALTGENPVPDEMAGDLQAMTRVWLQWADQNGYVATQLSYVV